MAWDDITEIRRRNLRLIAENHGTAEVCAKLGFSRQRLSVLIGFTASKEIGTDLARRIEQAFGIEANWMDNSHQEQPSVIEMLFRYAQTYHPDKFGALAKVVEGYISTGIQTRAQNSVATALPVHENRSRDDERNAVVSNTPAPSGKNSDQPVARRRRKSNDGLSLQDLRVKKSSG